MGVKDFNVNQTVFAVTMNTGRNIEPTIRESQVKTVGRKYVTTYNDRKYASENWFEYGLVENIDWGEKTFLFQSLQDVEDYIEKCNLETWLNGIRCDHRKYTLEQLRQVKEILGN